MKRKMVVFFVLTLLITSFTVNAETCKVLKQNGVDQEQTQQDGDGYPIYRSLKCAQGFIPTVDKLTAVQLYLYSVGEPFSGYDITVSIRDDLDGGDLTSVTVSADDVGYNGWLSFDFPDINITPGEKYYIVAISINGLQYHHYCWFTGSGNPYPNGHGWLYGFEKEWYLTYDNTEDFCFKTWYTEEESNNNIELKLTKLFEKYPNVIRLFKQIFL